MLSVVLVGIKHREAGPQTFDLAVLYLISTHESLRGAFFFQKDLIGRQWHPSQGCHGTDLSTEAIHNQEVT